MKGWHKESYRHYLAAKGVQTKRYNTNKYYKRKGTVLGRIVDKEQGGVDVDESGKYFRGPSSDNINDLFVDSLQDNDFKTFNRMSRTRKFYKDAVKEHYFTPVPVVKGVDIKPKLSKSTRTGMRRNLLGEDEQGGVEDVGVKDKFDAIRQFGAVARKKKMDKKELAFVRASVPQNFNLDVDDVDDLIIKVKGNHGRFWDEVEKYDRRESFDNVKSVPYNAKIPKRISQFSEEEQLANFEKKVSKKFDEAEKI